MTTSTPFHDLIRETAAEFMAEGGRGGERERGGENMSSVLLDKLDPIMEILLLLEAERRQTTVGYEIPNFDLEPADRIQANFPGDHTALADAYNPRQQEIQLLKSIARNWALIAAMGMKYPYSAGFLGPKEKAESNQNLFVVVGSPKSVLTSIGRLERQPVESGQFGLYVSHQTAKQLSEDELANLDRLMGTVIERYPQARMRGCIFDDTYLEVPLAFMYSEKGIETCKNMGRNPQADLSLPDLQSLFAATYHERPQHRLDTYIGFSIPNL